MKFVTETGLNDPLLKFSLFPNSQNLYLRNLHEVVLSFLAYSIIYEYLSTPILDIFLPLFFVGKKRAKQLEQWKDLKTSKDNKKKQSFLNYKVHIVTMVQCLISIALVLPTLNLDFGLNIIYFQDDFITMISSVTAGYFLWDLYVCVKWFELFQLEFLVHAICSLFVFISAIHPNYQNYVSKFLLFELSSPFVNVNWLFSTLMKEFEVQIPMILNAINGILLMLVFFLVRICWGWSCILIMAYQVYSKKWYADPNFPKTVMIITFSINMALNTLNCVWLNKMVKIAKKMAGVGASKKKDWSKVT